MTTTKRKSSWVLTPEGWWCADPVEHSFAISAGLKGFDVIAFDRWLDELGPCTARDELLDWRAQAKAAGPRGMKPYLDLMHSRMREFRREAVLLPLARRAKQMVKPPGAVGAVTAYLRTQRRPGEAPADLWSRLKYSTRPSDDAPAYFDGDELFDAKTGKTISYNAFVKRLRIPKK